MARLRITSRGSFGWLSGRPTRCRKGSKWPARQLPQRSRPAAAAVHLGTMSTIRLKSLRLDNPLPRRSVNNRRASHASSTLPPRPFSRRSPIGFNSLSRKRPLAGIQPSPPVWTRKSSTTCSTCGYCWNCGVALGPRNGRATSHANAIPVADALSYLTVYDRDAASPFAPRSPALDARFHDMIADGAKSAIR